MFLALDNTRKKDAEKFFSLESLPFSSKFCVLNNLLCPKNMIL